MQTPKQGIPRAVLLRSPVQPSMPRNPPRTTGPQGSPGGRRQNVQRPSQGLGDEVYLWILVAVEIIAIGGLRKAFRRYHGG